MIASTAASASVAQALLLFIVAGILMILAALIAGGFLRRRMAHRVKGQPYECGETAVGGSWVQFDLRFYVAALVFVVFEVEVALLWPWAVVYHEAGLAGFWDMLLFFGIIAVGFAYLWRFGYLDWVRSTRGQRDSASS
jgi:NADH-quinone oxidoreductase subunit A